MKYEDMPSELALLHNLIDGAKTNRQVKLLRTFIREAADTMPENDVIRVAQLMLKIGVEIETAKRIERN